MQHNAHRVSRATFLNLLRMHKLVHNIVDMSMTITQATNNDMAIPHWNLQDRLHKAMSHRGITNATDMAALLRLHRNTVQDYLNGKRIPDYRTLVSWATICRVPVEWLEFGDVQIKGSSDNGFTVTGDISRWTLAA